MSNLITLGCKAILFDMDGTLVDSTPVVEHGWGLWAARHNIPIEEILAFSHGRPASAVFEQFLPGRDHTRDLEELSRFEEDTTEGILAVPGAAEILHELQLQNHPWAIVTSAWRRLAETRVTAAGLPLPKVIIPIDEIHNGKPDPEGFLLAAAQLSVAPLDCVIFEDTRPGIEAGLSAGMQVVGLTTTYSAQSLGHEILIRDFRDVTIEQEGDHLAVRLVTSRPKTFRNI
jgi:mannitol-1-/sugar-/sorbitol-6-phosphatase